jgi:hypothetical protein
MKKEERSAGRPCRLISCQTVHCDEDEIMLLVYDPEPMEAGNHTYADRRWAVITQDGNGKITRGGGIVRQWSGLTD